MAKRVKVVMVQNRPVVYTKEKDYVDLELFGYRGTVSYSYWSDEDPKQKREYLKDLVKLRELIDDMIETVDTMEVSYE